MSVGSTLSQPRPAKYDGLPRSPRRFKGGNGINPLFDSADFEKHRSTVPPWPTDPEERAELLRMALDCEDGWRTAPQRDVAYLRGEKAKGAGA